jgi:hypothetical protein
MIRTTQGLAAQRPPLLAVTERPGRSIGEALRASGAVRSVDLGTCSRVVGQSRSVTAECWFSTCDWSARMLQREQAKRFG